jgi:hypothetical protein
MNFVEKIKAYSAARKAEGRCVQCQYPWYDGLCECGKGGPSLEADAVARMAIALTNLGQKLE